VKISLHHSRRLATWHRALGALIAVASLGACSSGGSDPPTTVDTTLADYTMNGELDVWLTHDGSVTAAAMPWMMFPADYESASSCPRLHIQATMNGIAMLTTGLGNGRPYGNGALPLFMCTLPSFSGTVPGGLATPFEIRIWDETLTWVLRGGVVSAKATVENNTLRIGTQAHIGLDPVPPFEVQAQFDSDDGRASFKVFAQRNGRSCETNVTVSDANGHLLTNGPAPCSVTFEQDGISMLVPDVGDRAGKLAIAGNPSTTVSSCQGTANCSLSMTGPYGEPEADVTVHVTP